jgi:hypothetical protein
VELCNGVASFHSRNSQVKTHNIDSRRLPAHTRTVRGHGHIAYKWSVARYLHAFHGVDWLWSDIAALIL